MCIISVSAAGIPQPDEQTLRQMFDANPHGAGYMVARDGSVEISKGFMTWPEFIHAVRYEQFTEDDSVVYHFRIATQAGIVPQMTHPFPLTSDIAKTRLIDCKCPIGVAHNGVISLTSNQRDKIYSDTAHFIAEFLCYLVRDPDDIRNQAIISAIRRLTGWSRFALMDGTGYVATVGDFITGDGGILYSNDSFRPRQAKTGTRKNYTEFRNLFDDAPFMS